MSETTENPITPILVYGGKAVLGGLAGFGVAKVIPPLFWWSVRQFNPRIQAPIRRLAPQHKSLGKTMMVAGLMMGNPYLAGAGTGVFVANSDDSLLRATKPVLSKNPDEQALNVTRYNIPDWLPTTIQYNMLADILVEVVTKPTWNDEQKKWIPAGREHPDVLKVARQIVVENNLNGHNKMAVLQAIQKWVHKNIHYVYDPRWLDWFSHPYLTLKQKAEDCDGQCLLVASLGESLGIPMCMILIGQTDPKRYNHILAAGLVDGKLVPVETIIPVPLGYIPPHMVKKIIPLP